MSVAAMAWVWTLEATPTQKLVLIAVADHADHDGKCFPSVSHLVKKTSLCRRSVFAALAELEQAGLIARVKRQRTNGSLTSTEYELLIDPPGASAAPPLVQEMHHPSAPAAPLLNHQSNLIYKGSEKETDTSHEKPLEGGGRPADVTRTLELWVELVDPLETTLGPAGNILEQMYRRGRVTSDLIDRAIRNYATTKADGQYTHKLTNWLTNDVFQPFGKLDFKAPVKRQARGRAEFDEALNAIKRHGARQAHQHVSQAVAEAVRKIGGFSRIGTCPDRQLAKLRSEFAELI